MKMNAVHDSHRRQFKNELLTTTNLLKELRASGRIPESIAEELSEHLTNIENFAHNVEVSSRE